MPFVTTIARAMRARLILIAAVDQAEGWREASHDDDNLSARAYLDSIRERLAPAIEAPIDARVVNAPPAQAILDAADETDVDLIAMTMHGRTGLKDWLLGGTATKVVHASRRPVLVVRPKDGPSASEPTTGPSGQAPALQTILVPLDVNSLPEFAKKIVAQTRATAAIVSAQTRERASSLGIPLHDMEALPDRAGEVVDFRWDTPARFLEAQARGEIQLPPPTLWHLTDLSQFENTDAWWAVLSSFLEDVV